jgi:hypothetical protein
MRISCIKGSTVIQKYSLRENAMSSGNLTLRGMEFASNAEWPKPNLPNGFMPDWSLNELP